jgi:hypothetical protein
MKNILTSVLGVTAIATASAYFLIGDRFALAQGRNMQPPAIDLAIRNSFRVPVADAKSEAITAAARAFLAALSDGQREAAVFAFTDNTQRSRWSNLPEGIVQRDGIQLGDLSGEQRALLDALLAEFMSEDGIQNIVYQLVGEDSLEGGGGGRPNFGSEFFFTSFLGEPSTTAPWMFQFGGHHLAINATVFGPDISFAPMLTGGQPLHISYRGEDIFTVQRETAAAQAFMNSLTNAQKSVAVRGSRAINLLLGPGAEGTVLAPEGIRGSDLGAEQKALLLDVIRARLGFINDDDFAAKFATVEAELDDTYFGWWGPEGNPGTAYFRVTGPSLALEYAPQGLAGDTTDHAHSMYRVPGNDYGAAWIAAE